MKNHYYVSALAFIAGNVYRVVSRLFLWDEKGETLEQFRQAWETELANEALKDRFITDEEELALSISAVIPCPGDNLGGMPRSR